MYGVVEAFSSYFYWVKLECFIGPMLLTSICPLGQADLVNFVTGFCSFSGDMLYTISLQYTFGLSLRKTELGWTCNLPSMLVRHVSSATTVHLGGMQIDLDNTSVLPSKFSSASKTSLSSVHSFLVSCLVQPMDIAFGMVKSSA